MKAFPLPFFWWRLVCPEPRVHLVIKKSSLGALCESLVGLDLAPLGLAHPLRHDESLQRKGFGDPEPSFALDQENIFLDLYFSWSNKARGCCYASGCDNLLCEVPCVMTQENDSVPRMPPQQHLAAEEPASCRGLR